MSTQPDQDHATSEGEEAPDEAGARPSGASDQKSGDATPDVDSKTQYAGVTIDPDHPNDEG